MLDWSLEAVFDRQLKNACPLAKQSRVLVDLINAGDDYELKPKTTIQDDKIAVYNLPKAQEPLDIRMAWKQDSFQYRKLNQNIITIPILIYMLL